MTRDLDYGIIWLHHLPPLRRAVTAQQQQQCTCWLTIQRLPTTSVLPLFRILVKRLNDTPSSSAAVCVWLRTLLNTHVSYLLSLPASTLSPILVSLHHTIDMRIANLKRLLNYQDDWSWLMSQANRVRGMRREADMLLASVVH